MMLIVTLATVRYGIRQFQLLTVFAVVLTSTLATAREAAAQEAGATPGPGIPFQSVDPQPPLRYAGPGAAAVRHGVISHPPDPRVPLEGDQPVSSACVVPLPFDPTQYPDEYLCDGGDRGLKVHQYGRELRGLDTEDTVGQYYDDRGRRQIRASSRVCIYAPRFAALRTTSGPRTSRDVNHLSSAHEGIRVAGLNTRTRLTEEVQQDKLQDARMRSRASGLNARARDGGLMQGQGVSGYNTALGPFQNLTFVTEGRVEQQDMAVLSHGIHTAGVWTRDQNPVIAARDIRGHEVQAKFNPHQYVGIEDNRTPGELRIVKLADADTAKPGDVITFTLRIDNLGEKDLFGVQVIDNLTPRLEYVAGSTSTGFAGRLEIEPNGEGSSMLIFHLDEPLKGQSGGAITFQCRVR